MGKEAAKLWRIILEVARNEYFFRAMLGGVGSVIMAFLAFLARAPGWLWIPLVPFTFIVIERAIWLLMLLLGKGDKQRKRNKIAEWREMIARVTEKWKQTAEAERDLDALLFSEPAYLALASCLGKKQFHFRQYFIKANYSIPFELVELTWEIDRLEREWGLV